MSLTLLSYIYGGIVDLENVETNFIFDLMSHFSLVYRSIFNGKNYKDLELYQDFTSLQEFALVSLLKRDDLQLEEVVILEYIIKWEIAQNSTLLVDLKEWTKENFTTLKITLQQSLPLIRYFHISGTDVSKKIMLSKKILDKQLWKDLTQYFMSPEQPVESMILPPRTILAQELLARATKPFFTIISYEHVAEISSWIDRKSRSINGFALQPFWDTCHGHKSTVAVMKIKGTDEIIGGYNPIVRDATGKKLMIASFSY
ncbi:hypothetical protein Glove_21g208 [Diversispora epigaea]|uniref:BACK domain-containing protein n=1 Tax=Diversispora epigaea TaxID=1348612 RepID=A0A397JMC8_9GLOM|nr:hypothetical protein Glove_21g208 [Diversispora epigaea]